jgi:hypothetical protein
VPACAPPPACCRARPAVKAPTITTTTRRPPRPRAHPPTHRHGGHGFHVAHLSSTPPGLVSRARRAPDPLGFGWATPFDRSNPRGPRPGPGSSPAYCSPARPASPHCGVDPEQDRAHHPVGGGFLRSPVTCTASGQARFEYLGGRAGKRRSCPCAWLDLGSCFRAEARSEKR